MTIFDYIKDITVTKKGNLPLEEYQPFIITRWLSFVNPSFGSVLNTINNQDIMLDKKRHYQCLLAIIPKMKSPPYIRYVKKQKDDKKDVDNRISLLAERMEISQREASNILNEFNS